MTSSSTITCISAPLETLHVNKISERFETLQYGGGGELTYAMYGIIRFDHAAGQRLMEAMPNVIKIGTWSDDSDGWLQSTLQFISREERELRPGGETVITRLADILVIQAIRKWIDTAPEAQRGWLNALRDQQIGQAITAMHRNPAHDWDVKSLAERVNMSRSAFSENLQNLLGSRRCDTSHVGACSLPMPKFGKHLNLWLRSHLIWVTDQKPRFPELSKGSLTYLQVAFAPKRKSIPVNEKCTD